MCNMERLEIYREVVGQRADNLHFNLSLQVFVNMVNKSLMVICRYLLIIQWDMGHITTLTHTFRNKKREENLREELWVTKFNRSINMW